MLISSASTLPTFHQKNPQLSPSCLPLLKKMQKRVPLNFNSWKQTVIHLSYRYISCSNMSTSTVSRDNSLPVHSFSKTVIGLLGGGQLGRMLCLAASQMGMKVIVLDPTKDCPASSLCHQHVIGSFNDSDAVYEFAKQCSILTLEIEHVHVDALEKLDQLGIDCQPMAFTIRVIQDKYLQKVHFSQHGIPIPEFMQVDNEEAAIKAGELFGYPLMVKSRKLAYDGRGNAVARSKEDLSSAVSALGGYDRGLYVERWAPFMKELAVIVAQERSGSVLCYPVVETHHKGSICHMVEAPADVSRKVKALAIDVAQRAVSSLKGAGVFAVELFLLNDGQILLNEVAPRPHNSGHFTIESCYTSQFEQHLRAITGLPLGNPSMKVPAAVMYNLLGEDEGEAGLLAAQPFLTRAFQVPGAAVHWYDKQEVMKGRKMGHITVVGPSMHIAQARLGLILGSKTSDDSYASSGVLSLVGIIMGSDSDLRVMKRAAEILKSFDVSFELTIVSAHRTPERMFNYAASAEKRGLEVIIAGAGGAAHLPGMVASITCLPVIGVPVKGSSLDGVDSLLSILQMPKGIPVATIAIENAENAALLAVRILGTKYPELRERLVQYQDKMSGTVLRKAEALERDGWESYKNQ